MHAALERPDIRQYLTACHELFESLLALQGGVHIRVVVDDVFIAERHPANPLSQQGGKGMG